MESCVLCCYCCRQDSVESSVPPNSHSDYYSLESLETQTKDIIPPSSATRVSEQRTENHHEQDVKDSFNNYVLPGEVDEEIEKKNITKKHVRFKNIQSFLNAMTQTLLCNIVDTVSITDSTEENFSDSTKNVISEEPRDWISHGLFKSQSISKTNRGFVH